jgi:hypothetical protein
MSLVEIGHVADHGPAVTYAFIPDQYPSILDGVSVTDVALHLVRNPGVTHLPGLEAFLAVSHPQGVLAAQAIAQPTWVRSNDASLGGLLSEFHGVPADAPANLQDTHWTKQGSASYPPGAIPDPAGEITALLTNSGRDIWSANLWSGLGSATVLGLTGTATAATSTSLTGGTESGTPTHASNDAAGQILVCWGTGVYGIVTANTTGTTPVYTVDRWYTPNNPGGAAASTPGATTGYTLVTGGPPALFMGITANAVAPALTDVTLAGEITTSGGDLSARLSWPLTPQAPTR